MSYIVHNLTKRTIVISDLRAEIGPCKMLDLEKVAERAAIDRSYDLRVALSTSRLRLCSQGVVSRSSKPEIQIVEKIVEKHHHHEVEKHHHQERGLDEVRLIEMMKQVMKENQPVAAPAGPDGPAVADNQQVLDAVAALQQQIKSMGGDDSSDLMPSIDPVKLAEMQAKAIDKMSEDIETGNTKSGRKVILKNTRLGDLADELD